MQEVISSPGLELVDNDESNKSGRDVPNGLFHILIFSLMNDTRS
jgi:hypothetical protein